MLIAGTGSIAIARSEDGSTRRVGGWGQELGDEGSGYWIGREALHAVVQADDGRAADTALRSAVLDHLRLGAATDLIAWVASADKGAVAALVPGVAGAAEGGDQVAQDVLERASAALERHVSALLEQSGPWSQAPPLALWGGLIWEGGPLRDRLVRALAGHDVRLLEHQCDPPLGAAKKALSLDLP